jgi:hypothetical protein
MACMTCVTPATVILNQKHLVMTHPDLFYSTLNPNTLHFYKAVDVTSGCLGHLCAENIRFSSIAFILYHLELVLLRVHFEDTEVNFNPYNLRNLK